MSKPFLEHSLGRAAFVCAVMAFSATTANAQESNPMPTQSLPAIGVSEVVVHDLRDRIVASGFVEPVEQVQVQPLIDGQAIEALTVDVGDRYQRGRFWPASRSRRWNWSAASSWRAGRRPSPPWPRPRRY